MQTYDLIMIVVLAGAALFGYWKGLAWQIASLGSIFLSYFVSINFRGLIASKLGLEPPLDTAASMLILYLGSSLAVWIGFGFISKSLKEMKLKDWDHQAGALVGAAKGVLFCMLITVFAMTLGPADWKTAIPKSASGRYIAAALTKTEALLPKDIHQTIARYTDPVKDQLGSGEGGPLLGGEPGEGDILSNLKKSGSELYTKVKQQVGGEIESRAKKEAEDLLNELGKKAADTLPLGGSSIGESAPAGGSQNDPELGDATLSPLGVPRAKNAGRPSAKMPDFSSKKWQRK